jgi:hypothetical protein
MPHGVLVRMQLPCNLFDRQWWQWASAQHLDRKVGRLRWPHGPKHVGKRCDDGGPGSGRCRRGRYRRTRTTGGWRQRAQRRWVHLRRVRGRRGKERGPRERGVVNACCTSATSSAIAPQRLGRRVPAAPTARSASPDRMPDRHQNGQAHASFGAAGHAHGSRSHDCAVRRRTAETGDERVRSALMWTRRVVANGDGPGLFRAIVRDGDP